MESLSNAADSARATVFAFSVNAWLEWRLMTSSEGQVVVALEVLADLVDVQLRAVLRVAAFKELQEPLRLPIDLLLRGARRACLGRRPVRRRHAHFRN